jgi:Domain of unknown function (DUF4430)
MGRVALTKIKLLIAAIVILAVGAGAAAGYHMLVATDVQTVTNAQHQLTQISYKGKNGVDAMTLLKQHATVVVKHYSFGDMVASINGTPGNGPKYWMFYVNGKESEVGASTYQTKSTDTLKWVLQ